MVSMFNQLKKQYFDWRTWNHLYRNMKKHANQYENHPSAQTSYFAKPGISFSFDDSFRVQDWYKYGKDLFSYYDIQVTFNINAFHHYEGGREHTQDEIDMLIDLQTNGHEIAHHGFNHRNAVDYIDKFGVKKWVEDDIEPLFEWMEAQSHSASGGKFKRPVTYAFPKFRYHEQAIQAITPKYFKIVRGHLDQSNLTPFEHTGFAPSICIDSHYLANPRNVKRVMKFSKRAGCNLILTCHSILPDTVKWEEFGWEMAEHEQRWRISPKTIKGIIHEAKKNDLAFYTTAELGGLATFIDSQFEQFVRNLLSKSPDESILISELQQIKELDLSYQGITNLDGIQYFTGLENLNICPNHITDPRLLTRLPNTVNIQRGDQMKRRLEVFS